MDENISRIQTSAVFNYSKGITNDVTGFCAALYWFLSDSSRWKCHSHILDEGYVNHDTLLDFITSHKGIDTSPEWLYGILLGASGFNENAKNAISILVNQLDSEGYDVKAIYSQANPSFSNPLPEQGRPRKGDNITFISTTDDVERGTGKDYTIRRLARDNPELLERVRTGELSANAAAIEAGFRKQTKSIPINTPSEAVRALLRVFDADTLMAAIMKECR